MGRPSKRSERRREITAAFARVLSRHGVAGATIGAVASEAGVAAGLVHHHFRDKHDLLDALLSDLIERFRKRTRAFEQDEDPLTAYVDAALALDGTADVTAARCWVGLLSEGIRDPDLFTRIRRLLDAEAVTIERRSGHRLSTHDASAVLAYILGALVLGAYAPRKTAGFARPGATALLR